MLEKLFYNWVRRIKKKAECFQNNGILLTEQTMTFLEKKIKDILSSAMQVSNFPLFI